MKCILKILTLVCILNFSFPLFSYKPRKEFSDPWEYLEQEFCTKFDDYCHTNIMWSLHLIESLLFHTPFGAALGATTANKLFKFNTEFNVTKSTILEGIGMVLGGYIGYSHSYKITRLLSWFLFKNASFKVFKPFLDDWKDNKKFTPPELHDLFDQCNENYTIYGDELLAKHSHKIVEFVRKILDGHFPDLDKNRIMELVQSLTGKETKKILKLSAKIETAITLD